MVDSRLAHGKLLVQFNQIPRTIHEFERAVALSPDLAEAHFRLATVYRKLGQIDKRKLALHKIKTLKDKHLGKELE